MKDKNIQEFLTGRLSDWRAARQGLTSVWADAWAEFCSTPAAYQWLRRSGLHIKKRPEEITGDIEEDWKHRVHTGKVFELVEIIWGYLMQATFSTSAWFKVDARLKEEEEQAKVIQKLLANMLMDTKFRSYFGTFLRQLLVTGTSSYRPSWCNVSGCIKHEVIGNERIFLNPASNILETDVFLSTTVSKAWLKVNMSRYNKLTPAKLKQVVGDKETEKYDADTLLSFNDTARVETARENVTLYEYWGAIYDGWDFVGSECYAVLADDQLIHFEEKREKEVIVCNFIQLVNQSYGISPVTSSLGLIYADRTFLNLRLDNLSILVNNVVEYVEDAVLDADFKYFPGAKIAVKEKGSVSAIQNASPQFPLSYQEEAALDSRINRNVGTIPTVGGSAVRKAERVTAEEIQASRQVGGTRINQYYQDIEVTSINRMLQAIYKLVQKYGNKKIIDTYRGYGEAEEYSTLEVIPSHVCKIPVRFSIRGSEAVLTDENELAKLKELAIFMASNELLAQKLNWDELTKRILELSGFEDPGSLIAQATPSPVEQVAPTTSQESEASTGQFPTKGQQNAIEANIAADGGNSMLQNIASKVTTDGRFNQGYN